jgi:hypothetical protein
MPYQQPVVSVKTIRAGSVKVEVGDTIGSLVSLGTGNAAKWSEKKTTQDLISDNGGWIKTFLKEQTCEVEFTMLEIDLNILQQARGGIDEYSTIAGTLITGYSQSIASGAWSYNKFIKFSNQNGAGTIITPTSVTGSTNGLLVADTDYYIGQNTAGEYGIYIIDSATVTTESQIITIIYNYTPNAAVVMTSGGNVTVNSKIVRLTNTDENGKIFRITIYKAINSEGLSIDFPTDDEGKAWENTIKFTGYKDAVRTIGDQLFEIYDEQSVA